MVHFDFLIQPRPESLSAPDGVCEEEEGYACSEPLLRESPFCLRDFSCGDNFDVGLAVERFSVRNSNMILMDKIGIVTTMMTFILLAL